MAPIVHNSFTSTAHRDEVGAFDRWCRDVWVTHSLDHRPEKSHHFAATCTAHQFGPLLVSQISAPAMKRERTFSRFSTDHFDHYGLHIQERGTCSSIANGRTTRVEPGAIRIVDLAQEETVVATTGKATVLYVARDAIDAAIPDFHLRHNHLLSGPPARRLTSFITSLPEYVHSIPECGLPSFVDAALTYVVTSLLTVLDASAAGDAAPRNRHARQAVVAYIDAHLGDPDLSPASVSETMGLSRSALYRLFPMEGGVARLIRLRRLRRLRRIRRAIQDGAEARPIGQISSDYGFTSSTQFWRAFRQEYGFPPGRLRTNHREEDHAPAQTSFATLLRNLFQAGHEPQTVHRAPEPFRLAWNHESVTEYASSTT